MSGTRHPRLVGGVVLLVFAIAAAAAFSGDGPFSRGAEPGAQNGSDTPVVLIVLDELPTVNLMTADGKRIDRRRFPKIASFASSATWYRDNVAAGDFTAWAVPGILTGNSVNELTLPTAEAQPENFFTLLGPGREVHSMETVTELCPVEICPDGHQGEAPDARFADDFVKAKFHPYAPAEVREWISGLPAGEGTLSFAHIEVPHQPLRFLPSGQVYKPGPLTMPTDLRQNGWTADEAAIAFVQGRHLIQTGYADRVVGNIIRKIRQNGDFARSLIVLTADHGVAFDRKDLRRDVTRTNEGETVNPPLIIKYPGQTEGRASTASTHSLDILPTIAQALGADVPPSDGQPVDQATPTRLMTVSKDQQRAIKVTAADVRSDRRGALAVRTRRLGSGDLWHLGPRPSLIGRKTGQARALRGSRVALYVPAGKIRQADRRRNVVPALISGRLAGVGPNRVLALAWNGKIVATTRSFRHNGKVNFGAMVPPSVMKRGRNAVTLYLVKPNGSLRRIG